jgi:two-component system response regulator CpxR
MDRKSNLTPNRVLVIDDDAELCKLLSRFLGAEGFQVHATQSAIQGIQQGASAEYDLIILDVMLPEMDGFEVLRRFRAIGNTPVLMLTARGDDLDRILGLEMGADDYLQKPFNPRELAARLRAILRRVASVHSGIGCSRKPLQVGDLELNEVARTVRCGQRLIDLTTVEFDLLLNLLKSAGHVVDRKRLTLDVLGREFSPFDRSIDTHVWNLRRKIGPSRNGIERIKAIRGTGYMYAVIESEVTE